MQTNGVVKDLEAGIEACYAIIAEKKIGNDDMSSLCRGGPIGKQRKRLDSHRGRRPPIW